MDDLEQPCIGCARPVRFVNGGVAHKCEGCGQPNFPPVPPSVAQAVADIAGPAQPAPRHLLGIALTLAFFALWWIIGTSMLDSSTNPGDRLWSFFGGGFYALIIVGVVATVIWLRDQSR